MNAWLLTVSLQSACAVCVRAGSFSDPPDIPGLAHLLEHSKSDKLTKPVSKSTVVASIILPPPCTVVFMGSKKYPGENTFDVFTNRHGGFDNASTDYEQVQVRAKKK